MKNLVEKIKTFLLNKKRLLLYILFIIISFAVTYMFYIIFNYPRDLDYEKKVKEETKSVEINFDKKNIENIKKRDMKGSEIPLTNGGGNPFLTK